MGASGRAALVAVAWAVLVALSGVVALAGGADGEGALEIIAADGVVHRPDVQNNGASYADGVWHFDGKTSRLSFPYHDECGDKTVWVRFQNTESSGGDQFRIVVSNTLTGAPTSGFTIHTGWGAIMARICDGQKQGQGLFYRPKDINAWHDVCLTYQAANYVVRLYVDGQLRDIAELRGYTPAAAEQAVSLAWDQSDSRSHFSGDIARVRILARCLADEEIAQLSGMSVPAEDRAPIDPQKLPEELAFTLRPVQPGENIAWLKRNKGRMVCGVDNNLGVSNAAAVEQFVQAGFNTMITCGFNAQPDSYFNATSSTVVQVAERCKELGCKVLPYYWFTPGFFTERSYQKEPPQLQYRYVNRCGVECYSPCPLNVQYWDYYLRQGLVKTAALSRDYPLVGLVVDFELYCTEGDGFGVCLCDGCWGRFCRKSSIEGYGIPPVQRYLYLLSHRLLEPYTVWQAKEAWTLGAWVAQGVHAVQPDLALGYINYDRGWFAKNIVQGFAADGIPALAFTEGLSYDCGYTPKVDEMLQTLRGENTLFYPGLWISFWKPTADLGEQAYQLGLHADGWWVAPGFFLTSRQYQEFQQWDGQREGGPHGPQEEYLRLFKAANERLQPREAAPKTSVDRTQNPAER